MHDFAAGATAHIPNSKATSTWVRAQKRQQSKINDWNSHQSTHRGVTEANHRENAKVDAIFNKIVKRVQKQHPELSRIKARRYARTKDPVGRKYDRLRNQGFSASEISKRLSKGSKRGSSGRSSG